MVLGKPATRPNVFVIILLEPCFFFNVCVFPAGHDTTACTLVWAIDILARRGDIQERLRGEIASLKEHSWNEIERLTYLENFVREVLRVYCPGMYSNFVMLSGKVPMLMPPLLQWAGSPGKRQSTWKLQASSSPREQPSTSSPP